jgi:hypothetical protein
MSTLAVLCVGIAIYLRVRRHMKATAAQGALDDMGHRPGADKLHS